MQQLPYIELVKEASTLRGATTAPKSINQTLIAQAKPSGLDPDDLAYFRWSDDGGQNLGD
jgi:hypothetical protein